MTPPDVIYADDHLIVLNKPSGLLAVPGKTSDVCLSLQVQAQFSDALIVHRDVNVGVAVDLDFKGLLAPVMTVETCGFLRHHAIASCPSVQPRSAAIGPRRRTTAIFAGSVRRSASHS